MFQDKEALRITTPQELHLEAAHIPHASSHLRVSQTIKLEVCIPHKDTQGEESGPSPEEGMLI